MLNRNKKSSIPLSEMLDFPLAERVGFEPTVRFKRTHDFQKRYSQIFAYISLYVFITYWVKPV